MSGPKHTPEPWRVAGLDRDDENEPYEVLVAAEDPSFLVSVYTSTDDRESALRDEVTWANAKLIAAAPRLAEALNDAMSGLRYIRERYGELGGVGWQRVEEKGSAALREAGVDT